MPKHVQPDDMPEPSHGCPLLREASWPQRPSSLAATPWEGLYDGGAATVGNEVYPSEKAAPARAVSARRYLVAFTPSGYSSN